MVSNAVAAKTMVAGARFMPGMEGREQEEVLSSMMDRSFLTTKE
jgi:hypothetical protein